MTTIGLSYSLVKISTKCAPALLVVLLFNIITMERYYFWHLSHFFFYILHSFMIMVKKINK